MGDFDTVICEWEVWPVATQTYTKLKMVICAEYSKLNWQDVTTAWTAGHDLANSLWEEYLQAMEELVAELMEWHSKQIEMLIKANNDALIKLTVALEESNKKVGSTNTSTKSEK